MTFWLEATDGPQHDDVAERVRFWEEREASLERASVGLEPGPGTPELQGQVDTFLPLSTLRRDVHALLRSWFGPALDEQRVDLEAGALGQARSVLDVRAWLPEAWPPSEWLGRIGGDARLAYETLFALFGSRRLGVSLGRYPEQLAAIVRHAARTDRLRVWDAGCGTGEGTWELAAELQAAGHRVEVLGTTPWPLELLMAQMRERPHDPRGSIALQAFFAEVREAHVGAVYFQLSDLEEERPPGAFHVVTCHGVLGGLVTDLRKPVQNLARALAPGGILSVTDTFREDVTQRAARRVAGEAHRQGLEQLSPGLFRRPE